MKLLKKNIRKHKSYVVPQGACTDGIHIYCVYEKKHKYHIIVKYNGNGRMLKRSKRLSVGHGNDMTFRNGKLYITHSKRKDVIHVVDAGTLEQMEDIKIPWNKKRGLNEITAIPGGFALRSIKGNRLIITDEKFSKKEEYKFGKGFGTAQGMDYHAGRLYRGFSRLQTKGANHIGIYDLKGRRVGHSKVKYRGELESVFWFAGRLRGIIFRKKGKKGKKKYTAKMFQI